MRRSSNKILGCLIYLYMTTDFQTTTEYFFTKFRTNPYFYGYYNTHILRDERHNKFSSAAPQKAPYDSEPIDYFVGVAEDYIHKNHIYIDPAENVFEVLRDFYNEPFLFKGFYGQYQYRQLHCDKLGNTTGILKVEKQIFPSAWYLLQEHYGWDTNKELTAQDIVICFLEQYLQKIIPLTKLSGDFLADNTYSWNYRVVEDSQFMTLEFKVSDDYVHLLSHSLEAVNPNKKWEMFCYPGLGVSDFLKEYFASCSKYHYRTGKQFYFSFGPTLSKNSIYPHLDTVDGGTVNKNTFTLVVEKKPATFQTYINSNNGYI